MGVQYLKPRSEIACIRGEGNSTSWKRILPSTGGTVKLDTSHASMSSLLLSTVGVLSALTRFLVVWRRVRRRGGRLRLPDSDEEVTGSFDFSCKTPIKVLEIQADLSGDVTKKFINYTQQINRKLLGNTTPLLNLPEDVLDKLSKYPETTICTNK